jgi:hypothetical protein
VAVLSLIIKEPLYYRSPYFYYSVIFIMNINRYEKIKSLGKCQNVPRRREDGRIEGI